MRFSCPPLKQDGGNVPLPADHFPAAKGPVGHGNAGEIPCSVGRPFRPTVPAGFGWARTGWDLAFGGKRASEKALARPGF